MAKIIDFRPRDKNGKRRTYEKAADVIPMPPKQPASPAQPKRKASALSDILGRSKPGKSD